MRIKATGAAAKDVGGNGTDDWFNPNFKLQHSYQVLNGWKSWKKGSDKKIEEGDDGEPFEVSVECADDVCGPSELIDDGMSETENSATQLIASALFAVAYLMF